MKKILIILFLAFTFSSFFKSHDYSSYYDSLEKASLVAHIKIFEIKNNSIQEAIDSNLIFAEIISLHHGKCNDTIIIKISKNGINPFKKNKEYLVALNKDSEDSYIISDSIPGIIASYNKTTKKFIGVNDNKKIKISKSDFIRRFPTIYTFNLSYFQIEEKMIKYTIRDTLKTNYYSFYYPYSLYVDAINTGRVMNDSVRKKHLDVIKEIATLTDTIEINNIFPYCIRIRYVEYIYRYHDIWRINQKLIHDLIKTNRCIVVHDNENTIFTRLYGKSNYLYRECGYSFGYFTFFNENDVPIFNYINSFLHSSCMHKKF